MQWILSIYQVFLLLNHPMSQPSVILPLPITINHRPSSVDANTGTGTVSQRQRRSLEVTWGRYVQHFALNQSIRAKNEVIVERLERWIAHGMRRDMDSEETKVTCVHAGRQYMLLTTSHGDIDVWMFLLQSEYAEYTWMKNEATNASRIWKRAIFWTFCNICAWKKVCSTTLAACLLAQPSTSAQASTMKAISFIVSAMIFVPVRQAIPSTTDHKVLLHQAWDVYREEWSLMPPI